MSEARPHCTGMKAPAPFPTDTPNHTQLHMDSIIIDSKLGYDKVSANCATSEPRCNKKSDGSLDARRGSQNILNEPPDQYLSVYV